METPYFAQAASKMCESLVGAIRNSSFCVTKTGLCTYVIRFELHTHVITL